MPVLTQEAHATEGCSLFSNLPRSCVTVLGTEVTDVTARPTKKRQGRSSVAQSKEEQQLTEGSALQPHEEERMYTLTKLEHRAEKLPVSMGQMQELLSAVQQCNKVQYSCLAYRDKLSVAVFYFQSLRPILTSGPHHL